MVLLVREVHRVLGDVEEVAAAHEEGLCLPLLCARGIERGYRGEGILVLGIVKVVHIRRDNGLCPLPQRGDGNPVEVVGGDLFAGNEVEV